MDLLADPYALLVPAASPLGANGARPDQAALSEIRIIGCRWERRDVEDLLRERGVGPSIAYRSDDNGTVLAFVAAGAGAAVLPRLALDDRHRPKVAMLPRP